MITFSHILDAVQRIQPFALNTPIMSSSELNKHLNQTIFFKCECLQKTGAFKIRGAANHMLRATEQNTEIKHVVANSSGNHAQAVAYMAKALGLSATIYANNNISPIKAAATRAYGATLNTYSSRQEADKAVELASQAKNTLWVPPFDHPDVICGQGTAALEALNDLKEIDAVFAPCGGGGLLAGSLIATKTRAPNAKVIGAEPLNANDAALSLKKGQIVRLQGTPNTLADGAATPAVGKHTFPFLQQLDDIVEVSESRIAYWTQWLQHLLKLHVEPTCAMSMEAVARWAATAPKNSRALVMLSGGNISQTNMQKIWADDHLAHFPHTSVN